MRAAEQNKAIPTSMGILKAGLVSGGQQGVNARLREVVQRHLDSHWLQPFHQPSVESYQRLKDEASLTAEQGFILDSGCGTGQSTRQLAGQYANHLVVGVDRSQARLAKSGMEQNFFQSGNCILLRADLPTIWRLLVNDGHVPDKHFLLYPNPYPKSAHLRRRWHGHPVFPDLLGLGGEIELRSNWEIYALEFAQAASFATGVPVAAKKYLPQKCVSPFEKKYRERSQPLFSVSIPRETTELFRATRPRC